MFNTTFEPAKSSKVAVPKSVFVKLKFEAFEPTAGYSPFV